MHASHRALPSSHHAIFSPRFFAVCSVSDTEQSFLLLRCVMSKDIQAKVFASQEPDPSTFWIAAVRFGSKRTWPATSPTVGDVSDYCLSSVIDVNVFHSNKLRSAVFQPA